ncbi:MAG: hypothetical protein ABL999_10080 [Pyrinomonadaceae bacterium]
MKFLSKRSQRKDVKGKGWKDQETAAARDSALFAERKSYAFPKV